MLITDFYKLGISTYSGQLIVRNKLIVSQVLMEVNEDIHHFRAVEAVVTIFNVIRTSKSS